MQSVLEKLDIADESPGVFCGEWRGGGGKIDKISPIDGRKLASVRTASAEDYEAAISFAHEAFLKWRVTPGPVRGETVRRLGNALRDAKHELGQLVTMESGKIVAEGEGEVQEMIDICDLAVGQSRMLYGLTIQSERPNHRLMEQWHPLGVVAVISAFNFPVAVWSWNAALAAVCGDATVWKPSEKTPLSAIAVTKIAERVCRETGADPAIFTLLIGDRKTVGQKLANDRRIPLVSATGSVGMGLNVAKTVHGRLGRTIMELGGNNALVVAPSADIDMATQSIFFGAVGTAGQRCTSTRRVIMHESVASKVRHKLLAAYKSLPIGNPLDKKTVMGPLIDKNAVDLVQHSIQRLKDEGGEILYGGERLSVPGDCYMKPCLATAKPDFDIVQHETFGPLLYLMTYRDFDEAIAIHNNVPQGLTSSIFTNDVREAEKFLSVVGSDCGIANVNTGTSGAEIGGAFGGEKETGGGRESGSDCWKSYMRRQTNTINFSSELPLAQGIEFGAGAGSGTA
ncbi:MAG: aldehyde dehydrogenase family protein [Verrucomicrobia bacterium]|nr:MAG: aldehyde dehydrogenase family protein [Verrucomicrobiota bacterium]PYL71868.1 MAG: aldehyde dehydrogenase family protein [Verrucomicrobiota bacterium]